MPAEETVPSMSDSLNAAIDTVETTEATETGQPGTVAPPDTPSANDAAPTTTERARGPDGKYIKRETTDAQPAPQATAPVAAADPAQAQAQTPAAVPTDAAPPAWTPAAKEKWAALDPTVKGEIGRREREIAIGLQRAAEARQFGDSIAQEFAPYSKILADEGATPQAAVRSLLETVYTLKHGSAEHKHALFATLAQQYEIDLRRIVERQIDPEKARLQWELDSRNVNDARAQVAAETRLQNEVHGELETFINAPGHEHYGTVRLAMAGLMQSGVVQNLQDAYDRACWADPTVRQALQLAENTRRAADQQRNRNAMLSVNGAPGAVSTGGNADAANLRSFLEAQFAGSAGRV